MSINGHRINQAQINSPPIYFYLLEEGSIAGDSFSAVVTTPVDTLSSFKTEIKFNQDTTVVADTKSKTQSDDGNEIPRTNSRVSFYGDVISKSFISILTNVKNRIMNEVESDDSDGQEDITLATLESPSSGDSVIDILGRVSNSIIGGKKSGEEWVGKVEALGEVTTSKISSGFSHDAKIATDGIIRQGSNSSISFMESIEELVSMTHGGTTESTVVAVAQVLCSISEGAENTSNIEQLTTVFNDIKSSIESYDNFNSYPTAIKELLTAIQSGYKFDVVDTFSHVGMLNKSLAGNGMTKIGIAKMYMKHNSVSRFFLSRNKIEYGYLVRGALKLNTVLHKENISNDPYLTLDDINIKPK